MIQTSTLCIQCRTLVELEDIDSRWCASCECLDYSIDSPLGIGATPEDALQEWLTRAATYNTPLEPSTLATFIVPPPPEGWGLSVTKWDAVLGAYVIPAENIDEALQRGQTFGDSIHYGPREGQKAANQ